MMMTLGFVATTFAVPAATADTQTICPTDTPSGPCVRIDPSSSAGDGDCDDSNGAGAVSHTADAWTGTYPAGNSTLEVENQCNEPYGGPYASDWTGAHVTLYTPLDRYPTKWVGIYWGNNWQGDCVAGAFTGGRWGPNVYQDLSPVICSVSHEPPTLPTLP
jgi:hypothetical protein